MLHLFVCFELFGKRNRIAFENVDYQCKHLNPLLCVTF